MTRPSSLADLATIFDSQPISGMRNRIINGDMRIDQRNAGAAVTVVSLGAGYGVDRHPVFNVGSNSITTQRVSVTGLAGFINALRFTGSASNIGVNYFHRLEANNVYDLAGVAVTFSAWVWSGALRTVTAQITTPNSFENFASQTSGGTTTWAVTTTPTRFTWTFTMPANAVNGAEMAILCGNLLATETVNITGVQLEAGAFATPFERRQFGQELQLCQRYFYALPNTSNLANGMWGSLYTTNAGRVWVKFPVPMRVTPVMSGTATSNVFEIVGLGNIATSTLTNIVLSGECATFDGTSLSSTGAMGQPFAYRGPAQFNAEL